MDSSVPCFVDGVYLLEFFGNALAGVAEVSYVDR
jgi:hypothetical protein